MRRAIEIEIVGPTPQPGARLLCPKPFDHWGQRFHRFDTRGGGAQSLLRARNSECEAFWVAPANATAPTLRYEVELSGTAAPDWVWRVQSNRHTVAADALVAIARDDAAGAADQSQALRRIIDRAADMFGYGHVPDEERFNAGQDEVPALCGTTRGSCVDINTYVLAAALSLGVRGQYVAGYWFHPEKVQTLDMHCWLVFEPDGKLEFWDVAHGLKWAATLGASVRAGLNPAGGRRVAMSCGRGLEFETPAGLVEISHFAEPVWVGPDGKLTEPEIIVRVEDPNGVRTQFPVDSPWARGEAV